jgi:hypothetical protein
LSLFYGQPETGEYSGSGNINGFPRRDTIPSLHMRIMEAMPYRATSTWLPRVLFESALITVSILLALALDEWRENRQDELTIELAMSNFLSEIRQNKARVDDAAPFNKGLKNVLSNRQAAGDIKTVTEFLAIVESYNPPVLQSTAWETALATGSVSKMDYNLVSALSLTYGLQNRYQQASRSGVAELTNPRNLSEGGLDLAVYNAVRYLGDMSSMETELSVVYEEAESVIQDSWMKMKQATPEEAKAWAAKPMQR